MEPDVWQSLRMFRKIAVSLALVPLAGCFSPEAPATTEAATDGSGTVGLGSSNTTNSGSAPSSNGNDASGTSSGDEEGTDPDDATGPTSGSASDDTAGSGGIPEGCGDGVLDDGEACDDGNDVNGDGCNIDCVESGQQVWESVVETSPLSATALAVNDENEVLVVANSPNGSNYYSDWRRLYGPSGDTISTGSTGGLDVSRVAASASDWVVAYLDEVSPDFGAPSTVTVHPLLFADVRINTPRGIDLASAA